MARTKRIYFAVNRVDIDRRGVTALLEMLRYDRATVELDEGGVVLFSSDRGPTTARWQSFGLGVILVESSTDPAAMYGFMRQAQAANGARSR